LFIGRLFRYGCTGKYPKWLDTGIHGATIWRGPRFRASEDFDIDIGSTHAASRMKAKRPRFLYLGLAREQGDGWRVLK